jgi:uncharacterized protein YcgI (DUF1989 family)
VDAQVVACVGGQCTDYLAYSINLNQPATVAVNYVLKVTLTQYLDLYEGTNDPTQFLSDRDVYLRYFKTTLNVFGTIPVGAQTDQYNINPCSTGGGTYVGCSVGVDSVCISYVDSTVTNNVGTC